MVGLVGGCDEPPPPGAPSRAEREAIAEAAEIADERRPPVDRLFAESKATPIDRTPGARSPGAGPIGATDEEETIR